MPTYEFRCPSGHDFERFYKTISGAASEVECPECGKIATRQMSAAGFSFKGSGFYLTDYGKNAHRGSAPEKKGDEGSKAEPKAEPKAETKSDAKSDATANPKTDSKANPKSAPKAAAQPKTKPKPSTE